MARPAKFTRDDILDAAASAAIAHWRDATIAHVAERIGGPAGSIYHRFPSREDLFVALWLRAVGRFHVGLLDAARRSDAEEAAIACAVHIPRFCREQPADAVAMTLYRQRDLLESGPASLRDEVRHVNDVVIAAMRDLAVRRFGTDDEYHVLLLAIACQESPYGLVRRYLRSDTQIPPWLDDVVRASTAAILALGAHETSAPRSTRAWCATPTGGGPGGGRTLRGTRESRPPGRLADPQG